MRSCEELLKQDELEAKEIVLVIALFNKQQPERCESKIRNEIRYQKILRF